MTTNLRHCGSSPALPTSTPHPKPQAFAAIHRAGAIPSPQEVLPSAYAAKLARRAQRRRILDAEALEIRNDRIREENENLHQEVAKLKQELRSQAALVHTLESKMDKVSLRNENLLDALTSMPLDSRNEVPTGVEAGNSIPRVEDHGVRQAQTRARTKLNWGGVNSQAFKRAYRTLTAERNELLVRNQAVEKQLGTLQHTCNELSRQLRENKFQQRFLKEESIATLSDLVPRNSAINNMNPKQDTLNKRATIASVPASPVSGSRRRTSVSPHSKQRDSFSPVGAAKRHTTRGFNLPEVDESEDSPMENDANQTYADILPKLLHDMYKKLHLSSVAVDPNDPNVVSQQTKAGGENNEGGGKSAAEVEDEELTLAVSKAQQFTKSQARHLVDLVRNFQTCAKELFRLSSYPEQLHLYSHPDGAVIDVFEKISEACKSIAPGLKHVTFWIVDSKKSTISTRSARNGNEVKFTYSDVENSGIAGYVARTGKLVVLNNCVLGNEEEYHYNSKVDHLGSSREFSAPKNGEGFSKQSLATIPIFRENLTNVTPEHIVDASSPFNQMPIAILQVSKSASKSHAISRRIFSDSQGIALSLFGHAALWSLENVKTMQTIRMRDNTMKSMLHFPHDIMKVFSVSPQTRKSEPVKVELFRRLELQVVKTVPGARRCRIFAWRRPMSSGPAAEGDTAVGPGTLHFVQVKSYASNHYEDFERMVRTSCAANAGVAGDLVSTGDTARLEDPYNDPRFNANIDLETDGLAMLAMPIPHLQTAEVSSAAIEPWGVLQISMPWAPYTDASYIETITKDLLPQIAITIALSQVDLTS